MAFLLLHNYTDFIYITLSIVFFIASVYTGGLMPMLSSLLVGFSNHFAITAGGRVENIIL